MKFSQDSLLKLGLGAAGGYFIADFLLPKPVRGWAGHCSDCGKVGHGTSYEQYVSCCRSRSSNCQCPDIPSTGQDLSEKQLTHPGPWPKEDQKIMGHANQPFTPSFITGEQRSTGPINTGICKVIGLPGCDTVVDPHTGETVKAHCTLPGVGDVPVDCWVVYGIGALILILALKGR